MSRESPWSQACKNINSSFSQCFGGVKQRVFVDALLGHGEVNAFDFIECKAPLEGKLLKDFLQLEDLSSEEVSDSN
ncbi:MAG: hypothetical protein QS721_11805 [Candidatus Endonucleobacter sp. (ex Gigantidas childressi)]|nr:hypothetical protein [Candidatus Endonucleobacter sp. (ex Gigantidas childressi)]